MAADRTDVVYTARTRLLTEGHAPIEFEDRGFMLAGPGDAQAIASLRMFPAMLATLDNPFGPARVTGIEVEFDLEYRRDVLQLVDIAVTSDEVDPGSTVPVYLTIRRYGHPDTTRTIEVHIPERAGGQTLEFNLNPGRSVTRENGHARSLDDVYRNLANRYPGTSLVASLKMPTRGLRFGGHSVRALPGSALDALQLAHGTAAGRPFVTQERQEIPMGDVVLGSARLNLRVRSTPRD